MTDNIRPKGTVQVRCSCGVEYWVDALDPSLPDGPFKCAMCEQGILPIIKQTKFASGEVHEDRILRMSAAMNQYVAEVEICEIESCSRFLQLTMGFNDEAISKLRETFWLAANKLGWTGEPNKARCPDHEEHSCTQCGWSGTGFHACEGVPS